MSLQLLLDPVLHPFTRNFLNRAGVNGSTVLQSPQRIQVYDILIRNLVNSGIWQLLDCLFVLAASESVISRTNLLFGSGYGASVSLATISSTPTFTVDKGWTSGGTATKFLDSGYSPVTNAVNLSQNSVSIFGWMTSGATQANAFGVRTANGSHVLAAGSGAGVVNCGCNDAGSLSGTTTNVNEFFGASRYNSTAIDQYGASGALVTNQGAAASATVTATGGIFMCVIHDPTLNPVESGVVGMAGWGGGLTQTQMPLLYAPLHQYMMAVAGAA